AINVTQSGGGSFTIAAGAGQPALGGGTISTTSDIAFSNLGFNTPGFNAPATLSTTGKLTFAPGNDNFGCSATIIAAGYTTSGDTHLNCSLQLTGNLSSLQSGTLSVGSLSTSQGANVSVPAAAGLSTGGGTLAGAITGHGTY